jgi:long-subunit fatty acid transport protein
LYLLNLKKNAMKKVAFIYCLKTISLIYFLCFSAQIYAQADTTATKPKSEFWKKVQFGGGLNLNVGGGFTNIGVSPSAIYNVNNYFSVGTGLQLSYVSVKNSYSSVIYGGSIIALANPIKEIQLSVELEQLKVNRTFEAISNSINDSFWSTGLYLGAGYRTNNITIGARYNVLYDKNKSVYSDAFMPFVRVYF